MGFPRVSETFIASRDPPRRARRACRCGCSSSSRSRSASAGTGIRCSTRSSATPEYLPDPRGADRAAAPLARARTCAPFLPALRRCARRRPLGVARALHRARPGAARSPDAALRPAQDLHQGAAAGDRARRPLLDAPDVRHLHAHFAHGTTTVTWLAARIAGLPFSFTGHARDIYARQAQPARAGCGASCSPRASSSPAPRRTSATCSAIAPEARVHLVYHGLYADFARLLARRPTPPHARNGRLRVLGVGRLVAKKGFDVLVDACARPAASAASPFEALIVGQDDKHGDALRRRIAAHGLDAPVDAAGPDGPGGAAATSTAAPSALCMPCRLLPDDRDGIPNVLVEAMAAGAPVVATAVSGIPELVEDEVNGLLVEPDDPEALADALRPPARRPGARRAARGERAARPSASASTASASRGDLAAAVPGGARVTAVARPRPVALRHRARAPRPRARRGGRRRAASRIAGETRELGHRARLAHRRAARGRRVADRVGQVLLRARPRRRLPSDRRAALPRRVGAAGRARGSRRSRRTTTPARSPPAGSSTGSTPGSGCPRPDRRRARSRASREQARHVRENLTPGAQPPHARALRAADRRARAARARPGGFAVERAAREPADRLPPRRRAPRGARRTTT